VAERHISDGDGTSCRHCLIDLAAGVPFLILTHRPFPAQQPYAEQGPIVLRAGPRQAYAKSSEMPAMLQQSETMIIRG